MRRSSRRPCSDAEGGSVLPAAAGSLDRAVLSGASYLGVGPVFPSPTKEFSEPELAGLGFIQLASEMTNLPWFAIGGINESNVDRVIEAGATRIAVSAAVVRADSPRRATRRLKARLTGGTDLSEEAVPFVD